MWTALKNKLKSISTYFKNFPIAKKVSILFLFIFGIILIVNTMFSYLSRKKEIESLLKQSLERNTNQVNEVFSNMIISLTEDIIILNEYVLDLYDDYNNPELFDAEKNIALRKYTNNIFLRNSNFQSIHSIIMITKHSDVFAYSSGTWSLTKSEFDKEMIDTILENTSSANWSEIISSKLYFPNKEKEEIISFITPFFPHGQKDNIVIVNISIEALKKQLKSFSDGFDGIFISIGDGTFITDSDHTGEILTNEHLNSRVLHNNGFIEYNEFLLYTSSMNTTSWNIGTIGNTSSNLNSMLNYLLQLILTFGLLFLMLSFLITVIVNTITNPLTKLSKIMSSVENNEDFTVRFHAKYHDEIGDLAKVYNSMMDKIVNLNAKIVEGEKIKRNAEIKIMQMQIKPHFLHNSLESARLLVCMEDPKSLEILNSLSQYYKLTLSGVSEIVTVKEEVQHVKHYLTIQSTRYSSIFSYELNVNPDIEEFKIMKFTIQPLVENAIYHGVRENMNKGKGLVRVTADFVEGNPDRFFIEVYDTGAGMNENKVREILNSMADDEVPTSHIGLYNVNKRLELIYGKKNLLQMESEEGLYTKISIYLDREIANGGL